MPAVCALTKEVYSRNANTDHFLIIYVATSPTDPNIATFEEIAEKGAHLHAIFSILTDDNQELTDLLNVDRRPVFLILRRQRPLYQRPLSTGCIPLVRARKEYYAKQKVSISPSVFEDGQLNVGKVEALFEQIQKGQLQYNTHRLVERYWHFYASLRRRYPVEETDGYFSVSLEMNFRGLEMLYVQSDHKLWGMFGLLRKLMTGQVLRTVNELTKKSTTDVTKCNIPIELPCNVVLSEINRDFLREVQADLEFSSSVISVAVRPIIVMHTSTRLRLLDSQIDYVRYIGILQDCESNLSCLRGLREGGSSEETKEKDSIIKRITCQLEEWGPSIAKLEQFKLIIPQPDPEKEARVVNFKREIPRLILRTREMLESLCQSQSDDTQAMKSVGYGDASFFPHHKQHNRKSKNLELEIGSTEGIKKPRESRQSLT